MDPRNEVHPSAQRNEITFTQSQNYGNGSLDKEKVPFPSQSGARYASKKFSTLNSYSDFSTILINWNKVWAFSHSTRQTY